MQQYQVLVCYLKCMTCIRRAGSDCQCLADNMCIVDRPVHCSYLVFYAVSYSWHLAGRELHSNMHVLLSNGLLGMPSNGSCVWY